MYIARRTGGGRGVYEIAGQTEQGFSAREVTQRELVLDLAPYVKSRMGMIVHIQGGKPRIILQKRNFIHIQRQIAAILLLPKPIRAASGMDNLLPIIKTDRYAIDKLSMENVRVKKDSLVFSPSTLVVSNSKNSLEFPFLGRFGQVVSLWRNKDQFPEPVRALVSKHENLILAGTPLGIDAEKLVSDLQSLFATYSQNYTENMDVLPYLLNTIPNAKNVLVQQEMPLAEEFDEEEASQLFEGSKRTIVVNTYERNPVARDQCIAHYGAICAVCNTNFSKVYGQIGEGFIHVHHLKLISSIGDSYQIDPIADLRPVCPNCHAMLHKRKPPFTIEEMKQILDSGPYDL